jgi:Glycosyltransferase (GlcNAc)
MQKGPILARSLARKVLGNEEFCMQIDAHSDFVKDWDVVATEEWRKTQNEFGVISHVPAKMSEKAAYSVGGSQSHEVPRQCSLRFLDNGFPDYYSPLDGRADGKVVDLQRPLLGHGWSAAFSFAKCHLEETVPYDLFSVWTMPVEQFSRFARLWTRGYVNTGGLPKKEEE